MESGDIDHGRRRFVEVAAVSVAAAATLSLLPEYAAAATENSAIRPFRINVPDDQLVELRRRIVATRWPDRETVNDQSQGVQLANSRNWCGIGERTTTGVKPRQSSMPFRNS